MKISNKVKNIIYTMHPNLKSLNNYFKEMITVLNKIEKPVIWTTPSGMIITQKYVDVNKTRVGNQIIKKIKPITISMLTNKINTTKQKTAFMPNLVHSLDASHIILLIEKIINVYKNHHNVEWIYPLYTIHDCFGSP
jgi:DNA-directed RNA polymerase